MIYVIESIRQKDGTPHEREARRICRRVEIVNCRVGESMICVYIDNGGAVLHTSMVIDVLTGEGTLVVWTQNTEYTFVKEVIASAAE
ncbi:hypothetical protein LOZ80_15120 [Paenibacillus sp. HWE-109]|uniref:hypothetical protein n=1 Tax=Paenibacillus sp. HWE-109 TaxID=1306526 RepID=UPI001EDE74D5|nr:hypothetical protein [Paenibacillus sp. HWE-109]UKS30191.1 hypothetical protein LOZ80_15120 [Paenibacillus sp. HWE-109]